MKIATNTAKTQQFPHVLAAESYVSGVISGKIPACKWVVLACKRHVRDMAASITPGFAYHFDPAKAERVCKFAELMPHTKGKWAKKDPKTGEWAKIKLEPWQKFLLCSIFGWVKKSNGLRRFLKARAYIPRKNSKSVLGAIIGLFCLIYDNESGAEVYCGATTEKQALEVHRVMWEMLKRSPKLCFTKGITLTGKTTPGAIILPDGSRAEPIIGNPGDGASPHCAITDEYHEHKDSRLVDTMETGMGARSQPISVIISTAGSNIAGPCRDDWKACERILEATEGFEDDTLFAVIWCLDKEDDWDTVEALKKANPNWGVSIDEDQMLAKLRTAKQRANQQSAFRTKHLNQWVTAKSAYFNVSEWEDLAKPEISPEHFKEYPCYIGADFASHLDITAVMMLFCLPEERFALFGKYYLPEATVNLPEKQHYRNWHISGNLEIAGDSVMDFESVREDIIKAHEEFQVVEFIIDPTRMWGEHSKYQQEGIEPVHYRQQTLTMSQPMKNLEALIRSGKIVHNGDPILSWAISNTVAEPDKKENVYPNKENPENKIDPLIGSLFCLGRAMTRDPEPVGGFFSF